ncbi:unnamed protein product [Microthlaspi erraticum]|uniref:Uncharacterized protein n=1 Tax=Microthlaspi erraticum TaxID=1685480 RepID=A0A6D2IM14_9BRAS|nr:unnamed protein product [Microthlaspi erraticum]
MSTKCTYLFGQRSISNSRVKRAWAGVVEGWVTFREVVSETVGEAHGPRWACGPRERAWVTHREGRSGHYTTGHLIESKLPSSLKRHSSASLMSFGAFWSIWDMRSMEGLGMDAAQLDTQRKKGEAILKTSSTVYSTNRSSSSTRPAKLQLDRAGVKVKPEKCCFPLDFPLTLNLILLYLKALSHEKTTKL